MSSINVSAEVKFTSDKTAEVLAGVHAKTKQGMQDFCEVMVEVAKVEAPFLTGNLRDSIKFNQGNDELTFEVFTETGYGAYLELGTSRMAARPFMATGFRQAQSDFEKKGWT